MKPVPADLRGYISELQGQIQFLSERAANISARLAVANEQNELQKGRMAALEEELTKLRVDTPRRSEPGAESA